VVLLEATAPVGAAVLDGELVALRTSGRTAEYRRLGLAFALRANVLGTTWTLTCGGREYHEQPSTSRLSPSALAAMARGPANDLVDELDASLAFRRILGFGADGLPILDEARDAHEFHDRLEEFTPHRFVWAAILGLNVLVYLGMLVSRTQGVDDLLRWGALYSPRVKEGQAWRFVTAMFVHFGFLHLFFNMLLFIAVARILERIVGNVGFALLYLVSGVAGWVFSLQVNPGSVSAGASGAVFGLLGGVLGLMRRYHVYIPWRDIAKVAVLVALLLANNAIQNHGRSPLMGRIDIAAHVGGFLGGLACGAILCQRVGPSLPAGRIVRNSIVAGLGVLLAFGAILLAPRVDDIIAELRIFMALDQRLETDVASQLPRVGVRQGRVLDLETDLEQKIIPEWNRACARLGALTRVPAAYTDLVSALVEYGKLRAESWALLLEAARWNDVARLDQFKAKSTAADDILMRFLLTQVEGQPRKRS
jgi:membrane associated rhomboid family serine protease